MKKKQSATRHQRNPHKNPLKPIKTTSDTWRYTSKYEYLQSIDGALEVFRVRPMGPALRRHKVTLKPLPLRSLSLQVNSQGAVPVYNLRTENVPSKVKNKITYLVNFSCKIEKKQLKTQLARLVWYKL